MDTQITCLGELNKAQTAALKAIQMHIGWGGILNLQGRHGHSRTKRAIFRMPWHSGKTTLCKLIHSQPNFIRADAEDFIGPVYLVVPNMESVGDISERILIGPHLAQLDTPTKSNKRESCCSLKCNEHLKWVRTLEKPPGYIFDELNYPELECALQQIISEREDAVIVCIGTTFNHERVYTLLEMKFCYSSPCDWEAWQGDTNVGVAVGDAVAETYPRGPLELRRMGEPDRVNLSDLQELRGPYLGNPEDLQ